MRIGKGGTRMSTPGLGGGGVPVVGPGPCKTRKSPGRDVSGQVAGQGAIVDMHILRPV